MTPHLATSPLRHGNATVGTGSLGDIEPGVAASAPLRARRVLTTTGAQEQGRARRVLTTTGAQEQGRGLVGTTAQPANPLERPRVAVPRLDGGRPVLPSGRISGLQKWKGRVVHVGDDFFTAELLPFSGDGLPLWADFDRQLLGSDTDVSQGDVVYVTVRTVRNRIGYPSKTSSVRLRRLGKWSQEDVDRIRDVAQQHLDDIARFID